MTEPVLLIERRDQATLLTLNRPQRRNALSIELLESLCDAIQSLEQDQANRVVILRGAGAVFCAGLDLVEAADPAVAERSGELVMRAIDAVRNTSLVTIAAAHGAAMAGGGGLMAACDLVVAADTLHIGFPEVRRGLVPAIVSTVLRRKVGDAALRELFLVAEPIDAHRAYGIGLVNRVVPEDLVLAEALELASHVLQAGPQAVRQTKELLAAASTASEAAFRQLTRDVHHQARVSDEAAEGLAAFREKRPPRWLPPGGQGAR